jgi:drug/metabolite transporter (DMT)-like permease
MVLSLVVLVRIVSNPVSNVFQKVLTRRGAEALFVILMTHLVLAAVCWPVVVAGVGRGVPVGFWVDMGVVAVLTVAGNALLVQAVRLTDLSVLGPVNAYKSIISLIPGMVLLGEVPGVMGLLGMGLIVGGSYFIVDKRVSEPGRNVFVRFFTERGVQYRFAAMALAAVEAVFLKRALLASSPLLTFACWAVMGLGVAGVVVPILLRGGMERELKLAARNVRTYLWLATTTGLMQLCTIVVLAGFQVGYALALFQTSTLVSVFLGWRVFREGNIGERLVGSVVMVAGAVMIVVGR